MDEAQSTDQSAWSGLDDSGMDYVSKKGWKDPSGLLKSYRELERFHDGAKNIVEIPGVDANDDQYTEFYEKIGRPGDPSEYKFGEIESELPNELRDWLSNTAHKNGLTFKQAQSLFKDFDEMQSSVNQASIEQREKMQQAQIDELKEKWGRDFDHNVKAGRKAAIALGFDDQALDEMSELMGPGKFVELFSLIGHKMGEPSFIEGGESNGYGTSAQSAQDQIQDLLADPQFRNLYQSGDRAARRKMDELHKRAYPDG